MSVARQIVEASARPAAGSWRGAVQRPPWTDETAVRDHCTSCTACIQSCPEGILAEGPAGTPTLDFNAGACTFCRACAEACDEPVFRDTATLPWTLTASIGTACLLDRGVTCRSCTDACDDRALRFDLRAGPVGAIRVDADACTGCGACIAMCPTAAITLKPDASKEITT